MADDMTRLKRLYDMILSGNFSLASNAFDPMALAQQQMQSQGTPIAEMYLNSPNEDVKRVFSGLVSGQLDPIQAKTELATAFGAAADTAPLYSAVNDVVKEMAKTQSAQDKSIYAKAYLPNPMEQYTDNPAMAPLLPNAARRVGGLEQRAALLKKFTSGGRPTVDAGLNPQFNFSAISPELAKKVERLSPSVRTRLFRTLQERLRGATSEREQTVAQNAATLAQAGRTPFVDAFAKRAALAARALGK